MELSFHRQEIHQQPLVSLPSPIQLVDHFQDLFDRHHQSQLSLGYLPSHRKVPRDEDQKVVIYECASHTLRFIDKPEEYWPITEMAERSKLSLNGNLYWFACNFESHEYFIRFFDFSRESFKPFCLLPCQKNYNIDEFSIAVFKGDLFSLLKQCCLTREIGIWVTKNKISNNNGEGVVWIKLMTLSSSNFPNLYSMLSNINYFIYEKTLFMCCGNDETGVASLACIYIVREDMWTKIQIGSGIRKCCHCVFTPNLISLPWRA